jgi:GTPase SAR1 family protein
VIEDLGATRDDGTRCEAVLWDLAGQPDYRLIHALFLDKVDLGLLLFDPANRDRPLASVEYWLRNLSLAKTRGYIESAPSSGPPAPTTPVLLVAARCDRGTPSLSDAEIQQFCQTHGIVNYIATSAKGDLGIADLIERVRTTIPWERLPATTTTQTFKRIKEHVLRLKESGDRHPILVSAEELRRQLERSDPAWRFTDDEMLTAVGHLANHGYVSLLQRTDGTQVVLLAPDLLVNLASSIILEARRHERGLGLIDETRLLVGDYPLPELADLSKEERSTLLDATTGLFLERNLCFREVVSDRTWLVFPSLINEKRPPSSDVTAAEDVSYRVTGAVETVYPALVVQLGYTNLFRRDHHWQDQAQYELGPGEHCSFRQIADRKGEIELILSYSHGAGEDTRRLFQGAFERFLKRRNVQIIRFPAVLCSNGHRQERAAVRKAIDMGRPFFFCDECGEQLSTPQTNQIGLLTDRHAKVVREAEEVAAKRTNYEVAVAWLKAFLRDRSKRYARPTCFMSYAWGDPGHERWVEELADNLQKADVTVTFDRWHNTPGTSLSRFIERIETSDFVCAVGTPGYRKKDEASDADPVVQAELKLIKTKLRKRDSVQATIIPLLREGTPQKSFPPLFEDSVFVDFRDSEVFLTRLFELLLTIHQVPFEHEMVRKHRAAIAGDGSDRSRT